MPSSLHVLAVERHLPDPSLDGNGIQYDTVIVQGSGESGPADQTIAAGMNVGWIRTLAGLIEAMTAPRKCFIQPGGCG
jgi:hypothetical protein